MTETQNTRIRTYQPPAVAMANRTASLMITLMAVGAAAITVGGPLWSLLGVACVMFCAGWICHMLRYDELTEEIERYYNAPAGIPALVRMTTSAAVLQRTRSFALTPLAELESRSQ